MTGTVTFCVCCHRRLSRISFDYILPIRLGSSHTSNTARWQLPDAELFSEQRPLRTPSGSPYYIILYYIILYYIIFYRIISYHITSACNILLTTSYIIVLLSFVLCSPRRILRHPPAAGRLEESGARMDDISNSDTEVS